jgi:hypothetical protein
VSKFGIKTDPHKVEAVRQWPGPTTVSEIMSFFGFDRILSEVCEDSNSYD